MHRLLKELTFFREIERLKTVTRQNKTLDGRYENSAEHSWQLAVMAMTLRDYFSEKIDLERVLFMILLHDIGEIGAGDTSAFDEVGKKTSYARELTSVQSTFGYLPQEQSQYYLALWQEFEEGATPEARFARCMDALAPLMNHLWIAPEGENREGLTRSQVLAKKSFIEKESPELWQLTQDLLDKSVKKRLYIDI